MGRENFTVLLEDIKNDFDILVGNGNIGFYNTAEITYIFLIEDGNTLNVFTLIVFEEENKTSKKIPLTKKLHSINRNVSLGICQERINIDKSKLIFNNLLECDEKEFNVWDVGGDSIYVDKFKVLPKQFIPSTDNDIPLNSALKNNDENGSYVIEFFSEEKKLFNSINEDDYKRICQKISECLPLDLLFLKDRMFNIVFQFPINILYVETEALDNWDGIKLKLGWHPILKELPEVEIVSSTIDNETTDYENIIGTGVYSGTIEIEKIIKSGNVDAEVKSLIKNRNTDLFLWYSRGYYLKHISFSSNILGHNYDSSDQEIIRIINVDDEEYKIKLKNIKTNQNKPLKTQEDWINGRRYDQSLKELKKRKEFVPYGIKGFNNRKQALEDLRHIIKENSVNGVYLWDPYARAFDILNTVYFSPYFNSKIKVITSFSKKTRKNVDDIHKFEDLKKKTNDILNSPLLTDNTGINLEIRCQRESHGWKFHDRFLIFPGVNKAKVWSLGTSINSIGKSHSILMLANNPQNILDSFKELWVDLENSVLYKFPEENV